MSRIPSHTIEDAPEASRPILQKIAQASPSGRPLNLHAQMAHAPAVLAAYASLRSVTGELATLEPKVSWALNVAAAAAIRNDYMMAIAARFALANGWTEAQIAALRADKPTGEHKIDVLARLISEAAANSGSVMDATWKSAQQVGWTDEQLTEAFAFLGTTLFIGYFLNYSKAEKDI